MTKESATRLWRGLVFLFTIVVLPWNAWLGNSIWEMRARVIKLEAQSKQHSYRITYHEVWDREVTKDLRKTTRQTAQDVAYIKGRIDRAISK